MFAQPTRKTPAVWVGTISTVAVINGEGEMKKTDLERLKESRISNLITQAGTPGRFGREAANMMSRREQRKMDQAKGLIPFAVKLHGDLIRRLHELVQTRGVGLNELTAELLEMGLGNSQPPARDPVPPVERPVSAPAPKRDEPVKVAPEPTRDDAVKAAAKPLHAEPVKAAPKPKVAAQPKKAAAPKKVEAKPKAPTAKAKKPAPAKAKPKKK